MYAEEQTFLIFVELGNSAGPMGQAAMNHLPYLNHAYFFLILFLVIVGARYTTEQMFFRFFLSCPRSNF